MGDMKKLPGDECKHFALGRCFYEEWLNPGYTKSWRCQVLARWETAFDEFMVRAENFGVEQEAVPGLWENQFQRMARDVFHCQRYIFDPNGTAPACRHQKAGVCIMSLPKCAGRCRHFKLDTHENENE